MIFVKDLLIMKIGCLNIFLMRFVLGYGMIWLIIMFVMFEKGYVDLYMYLIRWVKIFVVDIDFLDLVVFS